MNLGNEWSASGLIQYEGPDGPDTIDLFLTVRPADEVDEHGRPVGWQWDVSISMEDARFGDEAFERGVETTLEEAQAACLASAVQLIAEGGGSIDGLDVGHDDRSQAG